MTEFDEVSAPPNRAKRVVWVLKVERILVFYIVVFFALGAWSKRNGNLLNENYFFFLGDLLDLVRMSKSIVKVNGFNGLI